MYKLDHNQIVSYTFCVFFSLLSPLFYFFFFFNDTATTEIYTLSLHDALPISERSWIGSFFFVGIKKCPSFLRSFLRSEEHTSELQSRRDLVCRLLLEKKKKKKKNKKIKKL